ncbi:hypothetical protein Cadr_000013229 [Camelus dromedarius]|uniref:Uncharacterized protein n=2 Tax=Camelus dromedarius TaxID=9838 RepID=A0A5N4DAT0_CAMDR|nr:hypothetical protein Cadr_000013229 [Camelus dromedarius]
MPWVTSIRETDIYIHCKSLVQSSIVIDLQLQVTSHKAQAAWPNPSPEPQWTEEAERNILGSGRKYLQRWHLEALLRRLQGSQQAQRLAVTWQRWVDAQGAEQLARTLLRQWHLRWAWRMWRRRVLRLQVARRLWQREAGWVLSQAFEKWHQRLAARGQWRGATSSPRLLNKAGISGGQGAGKERPEPLHGVDLGRSRGPSCSCDCSHGQKSN